MNNKTVKEVLIEVAKSPRDNGFDYFLCYRNPNYDYSNPYSTRFECFDPIDMCFRDVEKDLLPLEVQGYELLSQEEYLKRFVSYEYEDCGVDPDLKDRDVLIIWLTTESFNHVKAKKKELLRYDSVIWKFFRKVIPLKTL